MILFQMKVFYWIKFVEYEKLLKTQDNICYNMNFAFILSLKQCSSKICQIQIPARFKFFLRLKRRR